MRLESALGKRAQATEVHIWIVASNPARTHPIRIECHPALDRMVVKPVIITSI